MSQWKRIGNFKIVLVIFVVFLIGVLIGSGQSQKVSALSNSMYEDLKVLTDVIGSHPEGLCGGDEIKGPGLWGDQGDVGNLRSPLRLHAAQYV